MNVLFTLASAERSLRRRPVRSGLTALGVIIGVAAVITMVSLGNGAKARLEEMFTSDDWRRFAVFGAVPERDWRGGVRPTLERGADLTSDDYFAIRAQIGGITSATRYAAISTTQVVSRGDPVEYQVVGLDVSGFDLDERRIVHGMAFGNVDVEQASPVCLIGERLARHLFPDMDPLGRLILLKGLPFVVIGVVEQPDRYRDPANRNETNEVFVPITSLLRRLDSNARLNIMIEARSAEEVSRLKHRVLELMEERRGSRTVEFRTYQSTDGQAALAEGSRTMALLLAAISGVSLVVGGIGIMNIMLVSVRERTREIGVRLAIGSREREIMLLFLVESTILSVIAGVAGIALGWCSAHILMYLNDWPTNVTLSSIVAAFACSGCVGVFFGYYPARHAARLDPILALRSE